MRTFIKTLVLALAIAATVSTGALAAAASWTNLPVQKVPTKVMTGCQKLFAHNRIMKAEKSGSGPTVLYRMTIKGTGKGKDKKPTTVIFDNQGHPQG